MTYDKTNREISELEDRLRKLDAERKTIQDKIALLRSGAQAPGVAEGLALPRSFLVGPSQIPAGRLISGAADPTWASSATELSIPEKIALFRSLFKGRDDLYALRWESVKTGKAGYQPVCKNDWIRGVCRKPQIKCAACSAREFMPITDQVIHRHLFGKYSAEGLRRITKKEYVVGVYPLLKDETCCFLAVDFDKSSWASNASSFRATCARFGVPSAVERSRSGNGAHAWIFFSEPVSAAIARRLGSFLLTETLDLRPEVGLDSYDRLFPNQDTLPDGGFGNLIALPLQHEASTRQNSVFVGEELAPIPDQWQFLSSLPRMNRQAVERIADAAADKGLVIGVRLPVADEEGEEPWHSLPSRRKKEAAISGPLPAKVIIVLGNMIYIEKTGLPPILLARLIRLASFQNPEFYKAQAMRLSTFGKPRVISCAEDVVRFVCLPRGCFEEAVGLFESLGVEVVLRDERVVGRPLLCRFLGTLRPEQETAAAALLRSDTGVLAAATAFGKTVLAAKIIEARGVNTLILVHRRHLLDHWTAQIKTFLGLESEGIGLIGSGKHKPSGLVDVALIQSLCRKGAVNDIVAGYGHLIVDECHHIPASSFEQVARQCKAKYVLGLSATVTRKDGHHPIIFMQCGAVRYRVGAKQGAQAHPFDHKVVLRPTKFSLPRTASEKPSIQEIYDLLINDEARNELIFEDVMQSVVNEKRSPVVITERREHLEMLAGRFRALIRNVIVFKGGMGQKQRRALADELAEIKDDEERLLIATGKYLGEGFDDARLDTLFLTLPISWKGTLAQYAGRLHRFHYSKKEVRIYDYVDLKVGALARMYRRRLSGYRALGYETNEINNKEPIGQHRPKSS